MLWRYIYTVEVGEPRRLKGAAEGGGSVVPKVMGDIRLGKGGDVRCGWKNLRKKMLVEE